MDVRLLGPVEVSVEGRPVPIGAGKPRALLAMLALRAGSVVSAERLIDGLWGERPPASAPKLVQLYVSQLRKALTADGAAIVTRGRGYELRVSPDDVDVGHFVRLAAAGRPREALAMWRGPPLADVADQPFAAVEARHLEEMRLAAIEDAVERDLQAGRHAEVAGELEALSLEEPLRERLHAQQMVALYRSGRQADALAVYRQTRTALVDAIGAEPGPQLQRLHASILRQDRSLDLPIEESADLPPELQARTPMAGRETDLARLREHWRSARCGSGRHVRITGPGGIGKTRLAVELAGEVHRDGATVLFASGAGAPDIVFTALAGTRAARRPALLVLDDADRFSEDEEAAVAELAGELPGLPVLVLTTAEENGGADVDTLPLAPLDADEVRAVARLYGDDIPVEALVTASEGIPRHVHRAAAEWAGTEAARRLGDAASRAAHERAGLRAAEEQVAGSFVELQSARELAERRGDEAEFVACPFKGLAAFEVDDAAIFFGRERLVAELVARVPGAPLLGLVGPSGSGKSSALRAGLLAALSAGVLPGSERWRQAVLRPGANPIRALAQSTARVDADKRLVVAVDQFEEVFTACHDESERAAFVDALVECTRDPRRRVLVLLSIRADLYGRCAAYPELARLLAANKALVRPMRRDELRRAIELPARRAGLAVEPDLVDALVADVEGEPGALPLLSTSLLELWQRRDGRRLRLRDYKYAGGVHGAVARLAERAYERLDPERRELARRILLRLAGEGENENEGEGDAVVRRRVPLAELEGDGVAEVLAVLADDRLVTIGEGDVEVAHEALLREGPRLRGWLEEDAEGRRLHYQLRAAAHEWDAGGRDAGELYRGARLAAALEWSAAHEHELTAVERGFLDDRRAASERSHRRLRAVLGGVGALLVLAVGALLVFAVLAGVVALDQRGNARTEAISAQAQQLGARGLVENDLDASLLLARQGVALDDSVQTRGNLLAALVKRPAAIGVLRGDGERMWKVELSPDERTLAAGDPSGNVFLFDTRTRRRVATVKPSDGNAWIVNLAYSPDGSRLAIAHDVTDRGNVVALLDTASRRIVRTLKPPPGRIVTGLRYSADGRQLDVIAVTPGPQAGPALLTRFDVRTGERLLGPEPINRRHWSPILVTGDGERLVTAGDGEVTVRDAGTWRALERFPVGGASGPRWPFAYALSQDDRMLAIGEADGSVRLLDLQTGAVRTASGRHAGAVKAARFTADGRMLVTGGEDGEAIVWDVREATPGETLSGHANGVQSIQITRDGKTLYTAGLDGSVFIWDLAGDRRLGRPFTAGTGGALNSTALSSDGRLLARGQDDGAVSIVDTRTLTQRDVFPVVDTGQVLGIGFVPHSRLMVVSGAEGFLALVDRESGRVTRRLQGHQGTLFTPGISADGRLLATGSADNTVRLWSLPDGRALGAPLRFPSVDDAQLSPDRRWLTVVTVDPDFKNGALEVWDVRNRRRVHRVRVPDWVSFTRFSQDGRLVALGNRYGRTQVWSTASWKPVTPWLGSDASGIITARISPDDRTLATASESGIVRLWDIKTGQTVGAPLPGVPSRAGAPYFTPDGTRLIVSYETGDAYLWDIRPESLARHACEVAGRRLTRTEWAEFLPGRDYDPAC